MPADAPPASITRRRPPARCASTATAAKPSLPTGDRAGPALPDCNGRLHHGSAALYGVNPGGGVLSFTGGDAGEWRVQTQRTLSGDPLPAVARLSVGSEASLSPGSVWTNTWANLWRVRGVAVDDVRPAGERGRQSDQPQAVTVGPNAGLAALLAVRHNAAWWALAPQARDELVREQWQLLCAGLKRLPHVAFSRYHCRDLESPGHIDSLTWFDQAPAGSNAFEDLIGTLRASPAGPYIDREIELRLTRD